MSYVYVPDDDSEFGPVWEADEAAEHFSADELAESEPADLVVSLGGHRGHYLAAGYLYEAAAILGENNAQAEEWTAAADTYESHQSLFGDDTCEASPKDGFDELTGMCGACEYIHEIADEAEGVLGSLGYVTIWNDGVQVFKVGDDGS